MSIKKYSTDVREINRAAKARAMSGRVTPWVYAGNLKFRVARAKTVKGDLKVKVLSSGGSGCWLSTDSVEIETI